MYVYVCVSECIPACIYVKYETVCQRQVDGRVRCFVRRFIGLYVRTRVVYTNVFVYVYICVGIYSYLYNISDIFSRSARQSSRLLRVAFKLSRAALERIDAVTMNDQRRKSRGKRDLFSKRKPRKKRKIQENLIF